MSARTVFVSLLAAIIISLGTSCEGPLNSPPPVVRLGHAPHDHHSPLYVAASNPEYFRDNGSIYLKEIQYREEYMLIKNGKTLARIMVDSSTGGRSLIRKLSEEQFDISFGGVPAILSFIDKGRPVRIISPVMAEGAGLVVRLDLPVSNWNEFLAFAADSQKPVKIGYKTAVSVQNLIFEHALLDAGVSFSMEAADQQSDIQLINLNGAKNLIPAMESGLIDGFVVMQPFLALAETKGSGKTVALLRDLPPEGKWRGHPCCALAANEVFLETRPEISEAMLTLLLRARQFIIERPELSAEQIARWLDLPVDVEKRSLPTIDFSVRLGRSWGRGIDFWLRAMTESGRLDGHVREAHGAGTVHNLIYERELYDKAIGKM